jgi:hypothetical protein
VLLGRNRAEAHGQNHTSATFGKLHHALRLRNLEESIMLCIESARHAECGYHLWNVLTLLWIWMKKAENLCIITQCKVPTKWNGNVLGAKKLFDYLNPVLGD